MTDHEWSQPQIRIGNAERDVALARLKDNLDRGRLTVTEYDDRAYAVQAAQTSLEVERQFLDLPPVAAASSFEVYPHQSVAVPEAAVGPDPVPTETAVTPAGSPGGKDRVSVMQIVSWIAAVIITIVAIRAGVWWILFFILPMLGWGGKEARKRGQNGS